MVLGRACDTKDSRISFGEPLVVTQLLQPAVAPIPGPLGFPEDFAASLAERCRHLLHRVTAELALGHRRDRIVGKGRPERSLKVEFLYFALNASS
jgi:hypothetical protein